MHAERVWAVTHPDGRLSLAGYAKRTYLLEGRKLRLADVQDPVRDEPEIEVGDDDSMIDLYDDTDLVAPKLCTDVVVHGTVVLPEPATEHRIAVAAGRSARVLRLMGPRRAEVSLSGKVRFTNPERFERLPLDHRLAYGGWDRFAQEVLAPWLDPLDDRIPATAMPRNVGTFSYPRNAVGCAYFIDVDRERADGAVLPQIEDPGDPIRSTSFFVPRPEAWIDAPISGSLGWVPHMCYPRMVRFLGALLPHDPPKRPIREATFADGDDLTKLEQLPAGRVHPRALQGASPGLAMERLRGDEMVSLQGLFPDHESLEIYLPREAPTMRIFPQGLEALDTEPVLQTLRIDLDRRCLSLTWCGTIRLVAHVDEDVLDQTALLIDWRSL